MSHFFTIVKRDLKSMFASAGKTDKKKTLKILVSWTAYLVFAGLVAWGAHWVFNYLNTSFGQLAGLVDSITLNILNGFGFFAIFMVLVTGLQLTYKTVYESDDIGFLLVQPVPAASVFGAKFVTSYVSMLALGAAFGIPPWIGWGIANEAPVSFYLFAVLGFLLLLLLMHAVVTLLLLVAMRHIPGRKMKQLFIVASSVIGVVFVIVTQMFSASASATTDPAQLFQKIGASQLNKTWYLPSTWLVNAVLGTTSRFGVKSAPYAAALLFSGVFVSYLALRASGRWYLGGWAGRSEEMDTGKRRAHRTRSREAGPLSELRGTYWSVLRKDVRLLFRDPIIWYSLLVSAISLGFFIFRTAKGTLSTQGEQQGAWMDPMLAMMATMMGAVSSAQTGGISISREGQSFWILRGNPTVAGSLLWEKLTFAALPQVIVATAAMLASHFSGVLQSPLWVMLLLCYGTVASAASLQILLDVTRPDFTMKVEFGSAKSGKGTGKLMFSLFATMGLSFLWLFIWQLPVSFGKEGLFLGIDATLARNVLYGITVLSGIVMLAIAGRLGTKRMKALLSDS